MVIIHVVTAYALLLWHMLWPIAFGLALSSYIRSRVPSETIIRKIGKNSLHSASIAALFGMVSSICNYATAGMGHTLRLKGASWPNTLVFMIASTNIGVTMVVTVYGFLGSTLLGLLAGTAIFFMIAAFFLAILIRLPMPEAHQDQASKQKGDPSYWQKACVFFHDDLDMIRRDILVGLLVASTVSILVPSAWWQALFWQSAEPGVMVWLWNAMVGVVIAVLTFGCSIGNVALAAVLWWHGVSPGGVMAFMLSSLLTFPMLGMYRKYYGLQTTIRLVSVLVLGVLVACLLMDMLVNHFAVDVVRHNVLVQQSGAVRSLATLGLNLLFGGLGVRMYLQGRQKENGCSMGSM
ncbi:permease [Kistimonas asteriae]|uniref:permease n=1 Tax=Kistimonas asteriae TaxID=517724 RepID=UPI001BA621FC|nr:permease [Kistimonas asteriae]